MLAAEPAFAMPKLTGGIAELADANESEQAPTSPGVFRRSTPESPTGVVGFPEIRGAGSHGR